MTGPLALAIIALPFAAALLQTLIASWRIGSAVNAACCSLLFLLACALAWERQALNDVLSLVLLTSLVAMITSWYGWRDIAAAMAERRLDRRRVRVHHIGYQALLGGIIVALLADSLEMAWLGLAIAVMAGCAMTAAVRTSVAARAAASLILMCGAGLMLALLGILLLRTSPGLGGTLIVIGYGAIAGLLPLHPWLPNAATHGSVPGAVAVTVLLPVVPLLVFMHLPVRPVPSLLIAFGLATQLLAALLLFNSTDVRRLTALSGMAQIGTIAVGIGLGSGAVLLDIVLLALARTAVLQSRDAPVPFQASVVALGLLPLFMLFHLAAPAVERWAWLLPLLGAGALLASWGTLARASTAPIRGAAVIRGDQVPIWLMLAAVLVLAFWFHPIAAAVP